MFSMESAICTSRPVPLSFNSRLMKVFALVALTCIVFPITPLDVWPNAVLDALKAALATTRGKITAVGVGMSSIAGFLLSLAATMEGCEADLSTIRTNILSSSSLRNSKLTRKNEILRVLPGRQATSDTRLAEANKLTGQAHANSARRSQITRDLNNPDLDLTQAQRDTLDAEYIQLKEAYPGLLTSASQAHQNAAWYENTFVKPLESELSGIDGDLIEIGMSIANLEALKTAKETELGVVSSDMSDYQRQYDELNEQYKDLRAEEYRLLNEIAAEEAKQSQSGSSQ